MDASRRKAKCQQRRGGEPEKTLTIELGLRVGHVVSDLDDCQTTERAAAECRRTVERFVLLEHSLAKPQHSADELRIGEWLAGPPFRVWVTGKNPPLTVHEGKDGSGRQRGRHRKLCE